MASIALGAGERELLASEQMRDRIVALLDDEAASCTARGNNAALKRARILDGAARFIHNLPAQLAHPPLAGDEDRSHG